MQTGECIAVIETRERRDVASPELLARLWQTRTACLDLIRDLPPERWVRRGAMRGVTPSLIDLGTWLANHDRGHLVQIRELCAG